MRPGISSSLRAAAFLVPLLGIVALAATIGRGDEPGRRGRLFRLGAAPASTAESPAPTNPDGATLAPIEVPAMPTLAPSPTGSAQPRLVPQPRVSRAATEADPIVTRVTLGRSDDGVQFGMFLQVYADGTVIDSEGVHHVGRDALREVLGALEKGDLHRLKGHCGGPSTDFVEVVQMVVFERGLGRLRANAFSFSGNPQGCDHAVRHLQTTLDALQARLSRPAGAAVPASPAPPISLNGGSPADDR